MTITAPSITEVLKGQLYLGNLSAALSVEQREKYSISHIVSVCPDFPSTGAKHLSISVEDSEYEDLLIHLPEACSFIQRALDQGGRVLVHCVMGISRSSTVVAAFLMKTKKVAPSAAIYDLKKTGYLRECNFEPSPANATYRSWKRRHEQDVTYFLNHMVDTVSIIPDKLLLSSEFPSDPGQAQSLLLDLGVSHLLSISPAEVSSAASSVVHHHHVSVDNNCPEALLLVLPEISAYVRDALKNDGVVLVHSMIECRACIGVCAYLMAFGRDSPERAFAAIEDALPLFSPTQNFSQSLKLFQACGYKPTAGHPVVKEWVASDKSSSRSSRTSNDLSKTATSILSETSFDLGAFGDVLKAIQKNPQSFISVR
ncbi:protein-tyrosine phosphatase-like protein [Flammula alnicola]|nr:protein-tyrosine phosphatase-like protein [Flammula alnicola]